MLELDDIWFGADEIVGFRRTGDDLELVARWDWSDVPVLFGLPRISLLRWSHLRDDTDGLPIRVHSWEICQGQPSCQVSIRFQVEDE